MASASATLLAATLNTRKVRQAGIYRHRPRHLVVNWGNSHLPLWGTGVAMMNMLNKPQYVAIASNKIKTFQQIQTGLAEALPKWTTSMQEARQWLVAPTYKGRLAAVVCRTLTRANSGRGIVLAKTPEEVVPAPLYTLYKPKNLEFRIHVSSRYGVIDAQQKKKSHDAEVYDRYIRSHDKGWVFCREDIKVPPEVNDTAMQAIALLSLDFGAVDIGWDEDYGMCIYEVNTAPGLEGQTLSNYVSMLKGYAGG